MLAQAIQRVAEEEQLAQFTIVERLNPKMVARTEKRFPLCVPDSERKISSKVLNAVGAPCCVRSQNQFGIGRRRCKRVATAASRILLLKFVATVDPGISRDPQVPEVRRLPIEFRLNSSAQHRVAQANGAMRPGLSRVGSAIRKKMSEVLQQRPVNRRSAKIEHADDAAHSILVSMDRSGLSNGTKCRCSWFESSSTTPSNSTQACASNCPDSLRPPIRRATTIPRRRNSHHKTSECSKQFARTKIFRAAAASIRVITRAVSPSDATRTRPVVLASGEKNSSTRCHLRKPTRRKPTRVASSPPAASSTTPRSKEFSRRNVRHLLIMLFCSSELINFNPRRETKSRN